jgi:hypothetical protein
MKASRWIIGVAATAACCAASVAQAQTCAVGGKNAWAAYASQGPSQTVTSDNFVFVGTARLILTQQAVGASISADQIDDEHVPGDIGVRIAHSGSASSPSNYIESTYAFRSPSNPFTPFWVDGLSFRLHDVDAGDNIIVNAYDQNGTLIAITSSMYSFAPSPVVSYAGGNRFTAPTGDIGDLRGTVYLNFAGYRVSQVVLRYYDTSGSGSYTAAGWTVCNPSLTVFKTTVGQAGGPFGFTLTNTTRNTGSIVSTSAAGTPEQVDGSVSAGIQPFAIVTANSPVSLSENTPLPVGWTYTSTSCRNAAGSVVGSATATGVSIPGTATRDGAAITCTFINTAAPRLTLSKTWVNAAPGDAVTVAVSGTPAPIVSAPLTSVADAPNETDAATASYVVAAGNTYTISEVFDVGAADAYGKALVCTGNTGADAAITYSPGAASGTVTIGQAATNINCTFTNTRQAVIRLRKTLPQGRRNASDQFILSMSGPGAPGAVTTAGTGSNAAGTLVHTTATVGATYTLTEAGAGSTVLSHYSPRWTCTNARAGGQTPSGTGSGFSITPASGDDLTCTFINDRAPVILLDKYLPYGRLAAGDQFTLSASGPGAPGSVTTTGTSTTPVQSLTIEATAGAAYTLAETAAGTATLAGYRSSYACTNVFAGGQEPSGFGSSFTLVPVAGDDLHCTFANEPRPRLTLRALSQGGTGSFTFSGGNGFDAETLVTNTAGVAVSGATQFLDEFNVSTTITAGGTPAGFVLSDIACAGLPSGGTATPSLPARTLVLDAGAMAPGANVVCTFTYRRLAADVTLSKTASAGTVVSGGDVTFSLVLRNNGPDAADNAVLHDDWTTQPGLDCGAGPATCAVSGTAGTQCPAPASVTPAALRTGLTIPALPSGGVVTLALTCQVTATGTP